MEMTDLWITVNRNGQFLLSMTCRDLDLLLQGRADGNSGREVGDNGRASTLLNISSLKVCEATDFLFMRLRSDWSYPNRLDVLSKMVLEFLKSAEK